MLSKPLAFFIWLFLKISLPDRDPFSQVPSWHLPQHLKPNAPRMPSVFPSCKLEGDALPACSPQASHASCPLSLPHSYGPFCPRSTFPTLQSPSHSHFYCPGRYVVEVREQHHNSVISRDPVSLPGPDEWLTQSISHMAGISIQLTAVPSWVWLKIFPWLPQVLCF